VPPTTVIVERNVETPMRDGVILRADVYRPQTSGPLPVLLQRTPYGKAFSSNAFALAAAERGYVVVVQDTRGRWASDGDGTPFVHEKADGYDTVQWAAAQPWADGAVGMWGGSYVGYTQLAAAALRPPALKAIVPTVTFCDPYTVLYRGGVLALGVVVSWGLTSQAQHAIMREPDPARRDALTAELITAVDGMTSGTTFRHLPLETMPLIGRDGLVPFLADMLDYTADPATPQWQALRVPHADLDVPALHIGGWYDIFACDTLQDYAALASEGRASHRLLVGPWLHGPLSGYVGEVDFGYAAYDFAVLSDELQLRWFDHWLKGEDNGITGEPPIRIFVMGDNRWRTEDIWPLPQTRYTSYYLHSGGAANSLHGDGGLSPEGPGSEPVDTYVYDPRNPVPTRGGGLCCWTAGLAAGAFDQRDIESRPDVLVYTMPPLETDLEVTGPVVVDLWAASSAPDTDFTAKLVDVGPCGFARNVCSGIVRARYRDSFTAPRPLQPNAVERYEIGLGPTSNVFKAGHRIRVEIASSNFPHFDRNLNTGEPLATGTKLQTAVQTILHDAAHPSHILLPVIPR